MIKKAAAPKTDKPKAQAAAKPQQPASSFNSQDYLVEEFAMRWSYALPAYPPADFNYSPALTAQKLNCVPYEAFTRLKDVTDKKVKDDLRKEGTTLVHAVAFYPGLFRDAGGKLYDLRPNTDDIVRPSLLTFQKMAKGSLQGLLLTAYQKQLEELEDPQHSPYDREYETEIMIPSLKKKIG